MRTAFRHHHHHHHHHHDHTLILTYNIIIISDISNVMTPSCNRDDDVTATSACPHHEVCPQEVPHHLLRGSQQDADAAGDPADQVEARSRSEQLGWGGGWGMGGTRRGVGVERVGRNDIEGRIGEIGITGLAE